MGSWTESPINDIRNVTPRRLRSVKSTVDEVEVLAVDETDEERVCEVKVIVAVRAIDVGEQKSNARCTKATDDVSTVIEVKKSSSKSC